MAMLASSHVLVDNLYGFGKTSIQFLCSFLNFFELFFALELYQFFICFEY